MEFHDISEYIRTGKDALALLKSAYSLLPKGPEREEVEKKIETAERILKENNAKLAKDLGYRLCQCDFPPEIMLSNGRHPVHDHEIFQCPECKKQDPSEKYFEQMDLVDAHNEACAADSWVNARRR